MNLRSSLCLLLWGAASVAQAVTPQQVQSVYAAPGSDAFSAQRGASLWSREGIEGRQCGTCHGKDLTRSGQHARTRKDIDPMALSASPSRFSDPAKVEKWFKRNCKWTWDRECTSQEKGDLLEFLYQL